MKLLGLLLVLVASPAVAGSGIYFDRGSVDLTGTFTLSQLEEGTTPIGTFLTPLTVTTVDGIFEGLVPVGAEVPAGPLLAPMDWTLGSLLLHTAYFQAAGPFWSLEIFAPAREGLIVTGLEKFDAIYPGFYVAWEFTAPSLGRTGDITLTIHAFQEKVPEVGTLWLLLPGLAGLAVAWRRA